MIIQWTNKYSGEQGFVKTISRKGGYFKNTFNEENAKNYSEGSVKRIIGLLNDFCRDNFYEAVEAKK